MDLYDYKIGSDIDFIIGSTGNFSSWILIDFYVKVVRSVSVNMTIKIFKKEYKKKYVVKLNIKGIYL